MKWLKVGAVIFAAVAITALGIDAADTLQGSRSTLLGQVISHSEGVCPKGMVEAPMAQTFTCVDAYEASASSKCARTDPSNELETQENMNDTDCASDSKKGAQPWRFITREQANTACMRAGKRLPTAQEWHLASAGTPDSGAACVTNKNTFLPTGSNESCVSAVGAYDTIGNVWEWVSDDVIEGMHDGRALPSSGYVAQVDAKGVAVLTSSEPSELFYKDYFWALPTGAFGMIRGGFYGSEDDAGVYSIHADTLPTTAGTAMGFRCVK